ncbi:MAG: inner membrane-spanning protein YciB, partial [Hyphomicrobiaceae bacterium]
LGLFTGLALDKPFLKNLLGDALNLTNEGWRILTIRWAFFFLALAALNELIWRTMSETTWASFKVFGIIPLTMIFFATQWGAIQKHQPKSPPSQDETSKK